MTDKQLEQIEEKEEVTTEVEDEKELDDKDAEIEKWKGRYKSAMKKKQEQGEVEETKDVDAIVEEKLAKREVTTRVYTVIDQIPEKYREKFQEEFDELSDGKKLSLDNVDKYIKSALALSVPSDEGSLDSIKASAMVNAPRSSKQGFKKKENPDVEYSNKLLKGMGVL